MPRVFLTRFSTLYIAGAHVHHRTRRRLRPRGGGGLEAANAKRAPHAILSPPMEFEPSHPRRLAPVAVVGEGGMLRPRLRFGITSTSSTSRLITLSAAAVAAAAVTTVAAVGCGEAVVEVAYEEEEGEAKVAATKEEKK